MKWQTGWLRPEQRLLQTSNANDTVAVESDAAFEAAVEDLVVADAMANFDAEVEALFASATVAA